MPVAIAAFIVGAILLLDVGRATQRMATLSRRSPWWLKGPLADYSEAWRMFGGLLVAIGIALAVASTIWKLF
jgi:hypothetical protein